MMVFHDDVTFLNVSGLLLAILGAVWYRQYKQKPSSSLSLSSLVATTRNETRSSAGGSRTPTAYPATESGLFNLESESSDEDEEVEEAVRRRADEGAEEEVEVEMYNINRAQLA